MNWSLALSTMLSWLFCWWIMYAVYSLGASVSPSERRVGAWFGTVGIIAYVFFALLFGSPSEDSLYGVDPGVEITPDGAARILGVFVAVIVVFSIGFWTRSAPLWNQQPGNQQPESKTDEQRFEENFRAAHASYMTQLKAERDKGNKPQN